jgi:hypothetical protein
LKSQRSKAADELREKAIALVAQLTSIPLEELDRGGINLWVRQRMNGADFCDWQKARS